MNFKKWVKSIQTAVYNGARTVSNQYKVNYSQIVIKGTKKTAKSAPNQTKSQILILKKSPSHDYIRKTLSAH